MTRRIPEVCKAFVAEHEALFLRVYDDAHPSVHLTENSTYAGTLTAGYGHTGSDVQFGVKVTKELALKWLDADLKVSAKELEKVCGAVVIQTLTDNQYSALLSFAFNVGVNSTWNIWRRLKANPPQYDQVPLELQKFVYVTKKDGSKVKVSGLVNRRAAEIKLWSTEEPGSEDLVLSSSVTRIVSTPPAPTDPEPIAKSGRIIAAATTAVATAPVAINQLVSTIEPYADKSNYVQNMLGVLAAVAAACAVLSLVLIWLHKKHSQT